MPVRRVGGIVFMAVSVLRVALAKSLTLAVTGATVAGAAVRGAETALAASFFFVALTNAATATSVALASTVASLTFPCPAVSSWPRY